MEHNLEGTACEFPHIRGKTRGDPERQHQFLREVYIVLIFNILTGTALPEWA